VALLDVAGVSSRRRLMQVTQPLSDRWLTANFLLISAHIDHMHTMHIFNARPEVDEDRSLVCRMMSK